MELSVRPVGITKPFSDYLMRHFVKNIPGHDNQKVLLILDGHKSHISVGLCEWARDNGIILFYLTPHTSHILQPLDVSCYGPFKRISNNECQKLMRQTEVTLTRYQGFHYKMKQQSHFGKQQIRPGVKGAA